MGFLSTFLLLTLAALSALLVLLVLGSIYFDATNSEIPPRVEELTKLRIIHIMMVCFDVLGCGEELREVALSHWLLGLPHHWRSRNSNRKGTSASTRPDSPSNPTNMGFLPAFLMLILAALVAAVILPVVRSISKIPPGVEEPARFIVFQVLTMAIHFLGNVLERLQICSPVQFFRYLENRTRHGKDPALFIKDGKFNQVPVRIYQPRAPSAGGRKGIMFFHGGAWMLGNKGSHELICRYFARESDSVLVFVDYRLAPEHKYPAAHDDCLAATTHFLETAEDLGVDPTQVIVAGDSVGGNLATAVCQALAGRPGLPKLRAQILIYPVLQGIDFNLPSYQQNGAIPPFVRKEFAVSTLQYLTGEASLVEEVLEGSHVPVELKLQYQKWLSADNIPTEFMARGYKPPKSVPCRDDVYQAVKALASTGFSPLVAEDTVICRLPETCIVTCEYDVLRDDGLLYKKRLEDHSIPVTWHHFPHGFHGILTITGMCGLRFPSGEKGSEEVVNFIKSL